MTTTARLVRRFHRPVGDDLVALLDAAFVEFSPCAPRPLWLLEERGWTAIRRVEPVR